MGSLLRSEGVDIDQTRSAFDSLRQLNNKYGELAADGTLAAAGALPPPWGTAADVVSLGRSIWKGDWGGALFDVIGFVPLIGDGAKAAKIADRLNDIRRGIAAATDGLNKSFNKVKKTAKKYWDDIAERNRHVYEEAMKKCSGSKQCEQKAALKKGPQYNNTPAEFDAAGNPTNKGNWSGERGDSTWTPSNGGPPITYKNGFPDYGGHVYVDPKGFKAEVDIPMKGTNADFSAADNAMRMNTGDSNWTRPDGYTWHHNENGTTMQLIPDNVHSTGGGAHSPHMGGASMYGSGGQATEF